ncbi:glycosyltransferase [Alteromonas sp. McT4-15]|uniref:CgeB family protein n=1 Tax=Alteromonas sp. McT4-15 TaxID=2881256 RepID=UPI001CF8DA12|nr:glycosyltransferase [Alteromonas sp. McT4-15]MCB4438244.1 glycosyltransferase [Alteromonas sp. McT4-15]
MLKKHLRKVSVLVGKKGQTSLDKIKARLLSSSLFDEVWYTSVYSSVSKKRRWRNSPIDHFLEKGLQEQTSPGIWFDSKWYLNQYEDVAKAGINPLIHYLYHGLNEGRYRSSKSLLNPLVSENQFIRLGEEGIKFQYPIIGDNYEFSVSLLYQQYENVKLDKPCGILLINCRDGEGNAINKGVKGLKWSQVYGCWYRYLNQHSNDELKTDNFSFEVTNNTVSITARLLNWDSASLEVRNSFRFGTPQFSSSRKLPARALSEKPNSTLKKANDLKVALITDEFTYNSFKSEFKPIIVEPSNWKEKFDSEKPDIFFCESAWSGVDSVRRPWKGKVYASKNFTKENRLELLSIIEYCRKNNIPSVFWNKEDPTHYTDRTHDFVKTAQEFDFVFTSAEECVERYKKDLSLENVFALPFATNPALFNPLITKSRSNKVVFAGSWYANHEERSRVMEQVLDSLIAAGYEPEIYDRYYGDTDPLHIWPEKYQAFIKPGQPHDQMPAVYKSSVIGLNFNTVTDSSTMFARRVFELMSSNTLVVSNYAKGVEEMFGDLVVFADKDPGRLASLQTNDIDAIREQALTLVLREHTYAKRWRYMLDCIGYKTEPDENGITFVSRIASDKDAMSSISYFEQHYSRMPNAKLLLLVSRTVDDASVAHFYQTYNRFGITVTSESFIQKHALEDRFKPIETPFFMYFDVSNMPDPKWADKALLHSSYKTDNPISERISTAYQVEAVDETAALFARSTQFHDLMVAKTSQQPIMAYMI